MKLAKSLSIFLAIMFLAISCESSPIVVLDEQKTSQETKVETIEKSIVVTVDSSATNINYFKYKLTPYFSNEDGSNVLGSTEGLWVKTYLFPTDWELYLQQGKWNVQIEMFDSTNSKIGDTLNEDVYFNKTNSNLSENLSSWLVSSGKGYIEFEEVIVPKLYEDLYRYEMTANNDSVEVKNYYVEWSLIQNGEVKYNGTLDYVSSEGGLSKFGSSKISDISVGSYTLCIVLYESLSSSNKVSAGGEITDVTIFRNCTSKVKAVMDTSDYISCNFRGKQNETAYTGKISCSYTAPTGWSSTGSAKLTLNAEGASDIKWYRNGSLVSDANGKKTYTFTKIKCGNAGLGIYGTCSTYFDCVFKDSNGQISSCSYIVVAKARYGNVEDDSSVFAINTGDEIKYWKYKATPIDAIGDTFGNGEGTTKNSIYLDERMWTIEADAYNDSGILSGGVFEGYINKKNNWIDIPLTRASGNGTIKLGSVISTNINGSNLSNPKITIKYSFWNGSSWDSSNTLVENLSGNVNGSSITFTDNVNHSVKNGVYKIDISSSVSSGSNKYSGYCSVIVNVYSNVSTIIQGNLTINYLN